VRAAVTAMREVFAAIRQAAASTCDKRIASSRTFSSAARRRDEGHREEYLR